MHLITSQRELLVWRRAFFAVGGLLALTFSAKVASGDQYCDAGTLCATPGGCSIAYQITYNCCSSPGCYLEPAGDVCCQYTCTTFYFGGNARCSGSKCVQSIYTGTNFNSKCSAAGVCQAEGSGSCDPGSGSISKKSALSGDGSVVLDGALTIASTK